MFKKLVETLTVQEADLPWVKSLLEILIRGFIAMVAILTVISLGWLIIGGEPKPWMLIGPAWLAATFGLRRLNQQGHTNATINLLLATITLYATVADPLGFPMASLNQLVYALPIAAAALLLAPGASLLWAGIVTVANLIRMVAVASIAGEAPDYVALILSTAGINIVTLIMWLFSRVFQQNRQDLRRQIQQGQAGIEIGHTVTATLDPSSIIQQTVQLIYDAFGYYHVGLFMLNPEGDVAVLVEAAGEAAASLKERAFHTPLAGTTAVAAAISQKRRRRVVTWEESLDQRGRTIQFTYDRLPTRAELVIPLVVRDRVLGALDIHSTELDPFPEEDIHTLEGLIGNVANALDVARLLDDVQQRHQELTTVYAQTERRSRYLETTAELARAISALLDPVELLPKAAELISTGLDLYHTGIFLMDETGEWAVLTATNSEGGWRMMARGHKLRVGEQGIVGWVTQTGQPRIALDVGEDAVFFDNPDLPDTRSEIALPLKVGDRVIGVLDVQSKREAAFSEEDVAVLQVLTDQVAVAIENARLFQETQRALEEVQALQRYYVAQEWERISRQRTDLNAEYRGLGVPPLEATWTPEMEMALAQEKPIVLADLNAADLDGDGRSHPEGGQDALQARAALAIPIKLRGEVIGVLDLQEAGETRDWSEEDVLIATTVADQLALALENARLFEETRSRAQELEGINEVGRAITSVLDQDAVIRQVVDITQSRFGHYFVSIALIEGDKMILRDSSAIGDSDVRLERGGVIIDLQQDSSLVAEAARTSQPVVANNVLTDPRYLAVPELAATRSELDVPMVVKGRTIGVLNVQDDRSHAFSQTDVALLQSLANQAGVAIENARLFEETQRRMGEVQLLNDISLAAASGERLEDTLQAGVEALAARYESTQVGIFLGDPESNTWRMEAGVGYRPGVVHHVAVPISEGIIGWVIQHGEPVLAPDVSLDPRYTLVEGDSFHSCSELCVPLMLGSRIIGAINVESRELNAFTDDDLRLLITLAGNVAVFVERARLMEETSHRAQQLAAINEVGRAITSVLERDAVIRQVVDITKFRFGHYLVGIALIEGSQLVLRDSSPIGDSDVRLESGALAVDLEHDVSLVAEAARTGQPVLVNDVLTDPRYMPIPQLAATRSELDVPMIVKGRTIGVLNVQDDRSHAFTQTDVALLQSLANQAGVAIENARLFEETQRRMGEVQLLNDISLAAASGERLEDTLQAGVEALAARYEGTLVGLYLADPESDTWRLEAGVGYPPALVHHLTIPLSEGIIGWVIRHGESVLAPDVSLDPRYIFVEEDFFNSRSELCVPLMLGPRSIGAINVESRELNAFTDDDLRLLTTLAGNLAILLERARLFEETQHRMREMQLLRDASLAAASEVRLEDTLRAVAEALAAELEDTHVAFMLLDPETNTLHIEIAVGYSHELVKNLRLSVGEGITGWVAQHREPLLIPDVRLDPRYHEGASDTRSELCVPMAVGSQVIGVLNVESPRPNAFTEDDLRLLATLANNVAVFVERARLFEETGRRARQLAAINEVGRAMSAVLDLDMILRQIVDDVKARFGYYFVNIAMIEGDRVALRDASTIGGSDVRPERGKVYVELHGVGLVSEAARTGEPVLANNVRQDPRYAFMPQLPDTMSELCVPIRVRGRVTGVLDLESARVNDFDETDVALFQSLAVQAGAALENARLFEETQTALSETEEQAHRLALLNEMSEHLAQATGLGEFLDIAADKTTQILESDRASVALLTPDGDFDIYALHGEQGATPVGTRISGEGRPLGQAVQERRLIIVPDDRSPDIGDIRSSMVAPLIAGGRVLGTLNVASRRLNAYTQRDGNLLLQIASLLSSAMENRRLFEEARIRAEELAVLNELAKALTTRLDVGQMLEEAYRQASRLVDTTGFFTGLYDPEKREVRFPLHVTESEIDKQITAVSVDEGFSGYIVRNRTSLFFKDNVDQRAREMGIEIVGDSGSQSWLGVPLAVGDRVLGVMAVESYTTPGLYDEHDQDLLTAIASQVAIALQNAYLFEETRTRAEELAVLNELSQALAARLDVDQVLEETYQGASRLLDTTNFYVALYDPDEDQITFALDGTEGEVRRTYATRQGGKGLTEYAIHSRQPLLIQEHVGERLEELGIEQIGSVALSWLGAPLVHGDQVLGVIAVQSYTTPRAYDEHDQDLLTAIASQTTIALQNARLFEETSTHAEELAVLNELARALTAQLDVDQILEETYRGASRLMGTPNFYVGLYDPKKDEISFPFTVTDSEIDRRITTISADQGLSGHIVRNHTSVLIRENYAERLKEMGVELLGEPALSWLGVPLMLGDQVLGVMAVQDYTTPRAYDKHDLDLMTAVASQMAIALQNARLFEETHIRAEELAVLNEMGQALTAQLDVDQVLNEAYRGVSRLVKATDFSIGLYNPERNEISFRLTVTQSAIDRQITALSADQGLSGYIIRNRTSVLLKDNVRARQEELGVQLVGEEAMSWLGVPLIVGDRVLGVMFVQNFTTPGLYDEHDRDLLTAIASQAAIALQNANLFEETQRRAAQLAASAEVARDATAILEVDLLLDEAVRLISEQFGFYHAGVFLVDEQNEYAVLRAASSEGGQRMLERNHRLRIGEVGIVGYVAATGESRIALDVGADAMYFNNPDLPDTRSEMGLPLKARERVIGVLDVQSTAGTAFSEDDVAVLQLLADQLATAIANANLFQRVREDANRRALINEVNQAAASSLNVQELLGRAGEAISRQLGMPSVIFEWDAAAETLTPVTVHDTAGLDVTPAEPVPITAAMDPTMFQAIRTRQLQVLFDVTANVHDAATRLTRRLDLQDAAYIPLVYGERTSGLLALGRQLGHPALDEGELSFLEVVATNLGVALENAKLFQDAVETAERLAEVDRLKSQFLANMSHELRTPLNSIIGFSRVILKGIDGPLTDMQHTDLQTVYDSGQHLLKLINDILDLSKVEAGKMELAFEDVYLPEVIQGVMSTAVALVKDRSIELQQSVPEDLPTIYADERRIRQVLLNLVSNAAKFTEEGFIRVEAEASAAEVTIAIIDSGIGIPADKIEEIFQPFTQVDGSSTRAVGGTGLGLSICQSFVEMHSGRIWVESTLGAGSTFYVVLPIQGPSSLPEQEKAKETFVSEEVPAEEGPAAEEAGKLVLCVEDDEGVITLFRRYLSKRGYQVVGLTDPTRVLEEAKRIRPQAITLDVMMPGKDGWQVIQELKADDETRHIPVVMCTIIADKGRGISLGAADYLVKPIIEQDLLAALDRLDQEAGRHLVLVIDDQVDHRALLRRMIEGQDGYEVAEAGGGQEAITMLQKIRPQIIMLDLMMPEMDGFAVLETLKANEETRSIPIIIVTAKELTDEDYKQLNDHIEALIQKGTLDEEELLEDVAATLQRLARHLP